MSAATTSMEVGGAAEKEAQTGKGLPQRGQALAECWAGVGAKDAQPEGATVINSRENVVPAGAQRGPALQGSQPHKSLNQEGTGLRQGHQVPQGERSIKGHRPSLREWPEEATRVG